MLHSIFKVVLGALLAFGAQAAFSQPKPPADKAPKTEPEKPASTEQGQSLKNALAMCDGCHGIPGYKTAFPSTYHVPKIAGQQPGYIIAALKAYKSGERSHPSMRGIAGTLTEEDMKRIAEVYGAAK